MKIQTTTNTTTFENIKAGDVFICNNEYFMKLDGEYFCNSFIEEGFNAINLNTNKLDGFPYCVEVTPVNGTLVIEN